MKHIKSIVIFSGLLFNLSSYIALSDDNMETDKIEQIVRQEVEKYKQEQIELKKHNKTRQEIAQQNIDNIIAEDQRQIEDQKSKAGLDVKIAPVIGYKNKNQATLGLNLNIYYNFDKNTSIFFGLDGRWHNLITKGTYDYSKQNENEMSNFAFRSKWDVFAKLGFQYRFDNDIFMAYYTIFGAGNSNYKVVNTNYNFDEIKVKWGLGGELGYGRIFVRGDFDFYVQSYRLLQYTSLCFEGTIGIGFYFL